MLPLAMLMQMATSPGQTYGISCFNDSILSEFSLSRSELGWAFLLGTLLGCLPLSLVGAAADRWGIRRVIGAVAFLLGGACMFASQVSGWTSLFVSLLLLRMLGQSALTLLAGNTVSMWFRHKLGLAAGLMSLSVAMAFATYPMLVLRGIDAWGWRWTYIAAGAAVWCVALPLVFVFYRNRPEDIGQLPDGERKPAKEDAQGRLPNSDWTLGEAAKSKTFWCLAVLTAMWGMAGTAIIFHALPLMQSCGLSRDQAASFYGLFGGCMAIMQLCGGYLADRIPLNRLFCLSILGFLAGNTWILLDKSPTAAYGFPVLMGLSQGLFIAVNGTVWARYFGRTHLGKIRGAVWMGPVAGSSVGPLAMGVAMDWSGGYDVCLQGFTVLWFGLLGVAWLTSPPRRA